MSIISPKLLYQSSAALFLLSSFAHGKMGGDIIDPALQPLGKSKGAEIAKVGWMTGCGYLVACSIMIHKFSLTPEDQMSQSDTAFMFIVWFTNLYGSYKFAKIGSNPGMAMLFVRGTLLIAARGLQVL